MLSIVTKTQDQWRPYSYGSVLSDNTLQVAPNSSRIFTIGRLLRYKSENDNGFSYGQVIAFDENTSKVTVFGDKFKLNQADPNDDTTIFQYYMTVRGILPVGGSANQILVKNSDEYGDAKWTDALNSWSTTKVQDTTIQTITVEGNTIHFNFIPNNIDAYIVGTPILFTVDGTRYYGKIMNITGSLDVEFMGAYIPSGIVTDVALGKSHQLTQWELNFQGTWAESHTNTLILDVRKSYSSWSGPKCYLVGMQARCVTENDTGGEINVILHDNPVFSDPITPKSDQWTKAIKADPNYYVMNTDDPLEISTTIGSGELGEDLSVTLWLVNAIGQ